MIDQRKLLAANIKAFRDANSLSQEEFAEDCGMCSKMVSLLELGKVNTTIDTLDLLAVRMGTGISELFKSAEDIRYILISKEINVEDINSVTYGIGAVKEDELIKEFHDISLDYRKVKSLVNTFNNEHITEEEFFDLALDACD